MKTKNLALDQQQYEAIVNDHEELPTPDMAPEFYAMLEKEELERDQLMKEQEFHASGIVKHMLKENSESSNV